MQESYHYYCGFRSAISEVYAFIDGQSFGIQDYNVTTTKKQANWEHIFLK